ncbi:hypothetical protein DFH06DRAFT_643660 [Mycena polygramma]|nr:hypothetical protein DFH06DRAFT_643660 [Mycena polygramma]
MLRLLADAKLLLTYAPSSDPASACLVCALSVARMLRSLVPARYFSFSLDLATPHAVPPLPFMACPSYERVRHRALSPSPSTYRKTLACGVGHRAGEAGRARLLCSLQGRSANPADKKRIDDLLQKGKQKAAEIHQEERERGMEEKQLDDLLGASVAIRILIMYVVPSRRSGTTRRGSPAENGLRRGSAPYGCRADWLWLRGLERTLAAMQKKADDWGCSTCARKAALKEFVRPRGR